MVQTASKSVVYLISISRTYRQTRKSNFIVYYVYIDIDGHSVETGDTVFVFGFFNEKFYTIFFILITIYKREDNIFLRPIYSLIILCETENIVIRKYMKMVKNSNNCSINIPVEHYQWTVNGYSLN